MKISVSIKENRAISIDSVPIHEFSKAYRFGKFMLTIFLYSLHSKHRVLKAAEFMPAGLFSKGICEHSIPAITLNGGIFPFRDRKINFVKTIRAKALFFTNL